MESSTKNTYNGTELQMLNKSLEEIKLTFFMDVNGEFE